MWEECYFIDIYIKHIWLLRWVDPYCLKLKFKATYFYDYKIISYLSYESYTFIWFVILIKLSENEKNSLKIINPFEPKV